MTRKAQALTIVPAAKLDQDTPERFAKLTRLIRVNGKPLESVLFRLQAEKDARS